MSESSVKLEAAPGTEAARRFRSRIRYQLLSCALATRVTLAAAGRWTPSSSVS
ncbi:MAG: hypothetical protein ABI355_19770 [Solirubrobacteraceae bacterium]